MRTQPAQVFRNEHHRAHYAELRRDCAVICRRIEESSNRRPLPGTVAPIDRSAA